MKKNVMLRQAQHDVLFRFFLFRNESSYLHAIRIMKLPTKPELPAWVFLLLRLASVALVGIVFWLVTRDKP